MDRIAGGRRHPHRHGKALQLGARRRDKAGGLVHRIGQRRPLPDPRPGQLVGQPRRAGGPHRRRRRDQPVSSQHICGVARRLRGGCAVGRAGPGRQRGKHGNDVPWPRQRPRGGHGGADGDPADRDRLGPRGVVQRVPVAVDQSIRLWRWRDDDRAFVVQGGGKGPVDVVVVGPGTSQQDRRYTTQTDRHQMIVPGP